MFFAEAGYPIALLSLALVPLTTPQVLSRYYPDTKFWGMEAHKLKHGFQVSVDQQHLLSVSAKQDFAQVCVWG